MPPRAYETHVFLNTCWAHELRAGINHWPRAVSIQVIPRGGDSKTSELQQPKTSMDSDPKSWKVKSLWFLISGKKQTFRHFYKRAIWKTIRNPACIVFTPCVSAIPIPFWTGHVHVTPSFTLVLADAEGLKQSNGEGEQLLKFLSDNHGCYVLWSHVQPSQIITIKWCPGSLCSLAWGGFWIPSTMDLSASSKP